MIEFLPSLRKPYNVYEYLSAGGQVSSRCRRARRRRRRRRVATKLPPMAQRNFSPTPVESSQTPRRWYILVVSIEVTESATRGNSSHFALQIPRFLVLPIYSTAPSCPSRPLLYFFFRTSFFKRASFPRENVMSHIVENNGG